MIHRPARVRQRQIRWKARIVHDLNDYWVYPSFGYYRKGKIHCSCPMCTAKTNAAINRSNGPVSETISGRHGSRLSVTNRRFGKKNWSYADTKKVIAMVQELKEFEEVV